MKLKKILFATSHPIQYQVPLFQKVFNLNKSFLVMYDKAVSKKVLIADNEFNKKINWGSSLIKGYPFKIFSTNNNFILNIVNLYKFLKKNKIEFLILSGWNSNFYKIILILSIFLKLKIILRCENNFYNQNIFKKFYKKKILKILFKKMHKFIAIGKKNREMYLDCGVSRKKIINSFYFVDKYFFSKKEINIKKKNFLKKKYKNDNEKIFIFVGKLIRRKGINTLLQAIKIINKKHYKYEYKFLIIGSGPEELNIKNFIYNNQLKNIYLLNFKNQSELIHFYDLADYLILPSDYETWGLVANEALEMGTPCIVSDGCGCANDLIQNNLNGFIFPKKNHIRLSNLIVKILNSNKKFGINEMIIKKTLTRYNIDKSVSSIINLN